MSKKAAGERKSRATAGIETNQENSVISRAEQIHETAPSHDTTNESSAETEDKSLETKPRQKAKVEPSAVNGQVSVADIRKAVAFVNSVDGLDNAIGLLQVLKLAKEIR